MLTAGIEIVPRIQFAQAGGSILLTCRTNFEPEWKKDYIYTFHHKLHKPFDGQEEVIEIKLLNELDGGIYNCYSHNHGLEEATGRVIVSG